MKRSEFAYRVLAPVLILTGLVALPLFKTDTIPTWLPQPIIALCVLGYVAAFCALGYYEFHDPHRSYKCQSCGYSTVIPRSPYSSSEKWLFGAFALLIMVFLCLLGALILSVKLQGVQ